MKIAIAGSTGFIGAPLVSLLKKEGHHVLRLVRKSEDVTDDVVVWDLEKGVLNSSVLEGIDVAINLSGENIAGRWNEEKKKKILESRVNVTHNLCESLKNLQRPPKLLINASAAGFYGNQGDRVCTEETASGSGFLADVCRQWEAAAAPAKEKGIRVIFPRFGAVLSPNGGALKKLLLPFKMGLGGMMGSGEQYMSWVALDDVLAIFSFFLSQENLEGPFNVSAPNAITNADFTKILGKVLNRPAVMAMPEFAARLAFGEMADEVLLSSARVEPAKLLKAGYLFRFPDLEGALRHLLEI